MGVVFLVTCLAIEARLCRPAAQPRRMMPARRKREFPLEFPNFDSLVISRSCNLAVMMIYCQHWFSKSLQCVILESCGLEQRRN